MRAFNSLASHCYVSKNTESDSFVGIKQDSEDIKISFPLGYNLSRSDEEIRMDIVNLISVIDEFKDESDYSLKYGDKRNTGLEKNFPMSAYMYIVRHYIEYNEYYTEKKTTYKEGYLGKIDWSRTIKKFTPILQSNKTLVYDKFVLKNSSYNENILMNQIHKYCVYESFLKIGWIFTPKLPQKSELKYNYRLFINILSSKLLSTNNDVEKKLIDSMISIIEYLEINQDCDKFIFGTNKFEYIWEKIIDKTFGVKNKNEFFPRSYWTFRDGSGKRRSPLEPDTIMKYKEDIYILDAKYYKFGTTANYKHLPGTSSINKQLTYGEYVYNKANNDNGSIYNAFIMPYNSYLNIFESKQNYLNIGEALGDWKLKEYDYERIQAILVDVRYIMYNYKKDKKNHINDLSKNILLYL